MDRKQEIYLRGIKNKLVTDITQMDDIFNGTLSIPEAIRISIDITETLKDLMDTRELSEEHSSITGFDDEQFYIASTGD